MPTGKHVGDIVAVAYRQRRLYNRTGNVHPLGAGLLQGAGDQRRHSQPLAAQALASSVTAAEAVVSKTTCWQPRRQQLAEQQPALRKACFASFWFGHSHL